MTAKISTPGVRSICVPDWAEDLPDDDFVRFFKTREWSDTDLGPIDKWPNELRLWAHQLLADSRPTVIYWGPSYVNLYNEAMIPVIGERHPTSLGRTFLQTFPEIAESILPLFKAAETSRKAIPVNEIPLTVMRNDFSEEAFFTGNFTPLRLLNGEHAGVYNAVTEVTKQVLSDRRRKMLNLVSSSTSSVTMANVWTHIVHALRSNPLDLPFVLLYQVSEEAQFGDHRLVLRGKIGVSDDHNVAVDDARLSDGSGLIPLLRESNMEMLTRPFAQHESAGIEWTGHGLPSTHVTAAPLWNAGQLHGYVIVGCNPRRPVDEDWDQFMLDLSRQIALTVASKISAEESAEREQMLQVQLAESERQIRYMAQHSGVSMQQLSLDRSVIWANQHYHDALGQQVSGDGPQRYFEDAFLKEDHVKALDVWDQVMKGQKAYTVELRTNRYYTTPQGSLMPTTILLSAFPYMEDGKVKSIMACMTDVSRLKWAESWQARVAQEAQEAKKRQSQFTDAISHEVRNPLSAILQLADSIMISASSRLRSSPPVRESTMQMLDDIIEAAKTISLCANHQKRIVDDVLTLSKMDFTSVALTPSVVQLSEIVGHAVKILDADLTASNIEVAVVQEPPIKNIDTRAVICDSLRLTQILVNLISNAIKFTKDGTHRNITVRYGATLAEPRSSFAPKFDWATSQNATPKDPMDGAEWGSGEFIYLTFEVQDTGSGMNADELRRVFDRFEQATPKTSIKYGGSGLGLFICRSLTDRQGGGIGISSCLGEGTRLAFYVKSRQAKYEHKTQLATRLEDSSKAKSNSPMTGSDIPLIPKRMSSAKAETQVMENLSRSASLSNLKASKISSYHILLAEDNIVNQRVLQRQLVRSGCTVHVANNGQEALQILQKTEIWKSSAEGVNGETGVALPLDVILMDINMPIMDGLSCAAEIRSLQRSGTLKRHIEIIAVTANVRQEQVDEAKAAGVDAVLHKPFIVSELLHLIKQRVGR